MARAHELVGDEVELAVDGWLNPNLEHAVRLGELLRPYRLKLLEDSLPSDVLDGFRGDATAAAGADAGLSEDW